MNRRQLLPALAAGAVYAATAATASAAESDAMRDLLTTSAKEKKGVVLYVKGSQIPMLVTHIDLAYVEGRNQEKSRIVVRIDQIDAAAMA